MKSTPYGLDMRGRSPVLRLAPVVFVLLVAGSLFAGQRGDTPRRDVPINLLPFRQVTWIESRVSDFTDGQLDPCLYVSNRAHLEPTPGCVEFFTRFDVDNNGYYDLACSDDSGPNLTLYLGSDSGYYPQNRRQYPITAGGNVELADLNLDGYAELIHSGWREGRVNIYWGTPSGPSQTDTTPLTYGGQGEDVCVYDLDRDGYLDIILGSSDGLLYIFWGSASGYSSSAVTTVNIGYSIGHNIEVADLDKDGWADIALSCWTYNQCPIVYWGPGRAPRTTVWLPFRWKNAHGVALADLNQDGWLDIVYTGYDTVVSSFVYFGSATGFSVANRTEISPGQCYAGSRIADFNGDGWLDIVFLRGNWIYGNRYKPVIYYNTASGAYFTDANREEIGSDSLNASGGFIADLNDDDILDIFVNNMEPGDSSYILWGAGHGGHTALPANNDHHGVFREPGNFYDRGYYAYYLSSVFAAAPNGDSAIASGNMSWVADLPPWSGLAMAVRAGNGATPDSSWIGFQDVGSSGSNLPDSVKGRKYLQYRVKLVYSRPCYLPSLEKVDCLLNISPRHDVSVLTIVAPPDTVDSGAVVTPRAALVNYGGFRETTLVRLRIGGSYADSVTRILAPYQNDTVSFRPWPANQLGWFPVKCSSATRNDVEPTNDFVTDSCLVRVFTDAAAESILAPLGTLDSGTVVTPIARIRNLSAHAVSIPAYLTITGGYSQVRSKLLAVGASDTVHFPDWTASPIGNLTVRCSTGLADDERPLNDTVSAAVMVRARIDAAALAILLPAGTLDSGMAVTPVCRIANYGVRTESIPVRLQIGASYEQYAGKVLGPGATDTVSFPVWIASPLGTIAIRCSTALPGDQHNENDTISSTVTVRVGVDAAAIQILSPRGYVDSGTTVTPVARIANNGTRPAMIPVTLTVGSSYTDTRTKILTAGASDTVVFTDWTALQLGTFMVKCTTQLTGDQHPENDKIVDSVTVRTRFDASSDVILAPLGIVDSGQSIVPVARITNRSTRALSIPVNLRITDGYSASRTKLLGIGASDTVQFSAWTASLLGDFTVRCSTALVGDIDPANDTVSASVLVRAGVDAASVAILAPEGIVDSGTAITPIVRIANNGTRTELIPIRLRIGSTYDTTITKLLVRGTQDTALFPVWTATELGVFLIRCSTGLAGDQNPANDTLSSSVLVRARIDAAALAIIAPTGTLDSGTTVVPVARIANYGTRTEAIPVRFQIGSVYAESLTKSLAPGITDTVSFPSYTALVPGRYVTRCTVGLTGDQVADNNLVVDSFQVTVRLDVGVTTILAPIGSTDSGTVITPTALVHNYGTRSLTTPVRMRIGTGYNQQTSMFLAAGATDTIAFPNWIASPLGTLPVRCSTELTGDENTGNDAKLDSVIVGVRIDAASIAIIAPTGTVDSGTVVTPLVRIANFGTRSAAIPVTLRIGTLYQKNRTKTIPAGVTDTMNFALWTASELGINVIRCSTGLANDRDHSNDTISSTVTVRARIDAASVAIVAPSGTIDSGASITPIIQVANNGSHTELIPVRLRIGSGYDTTASKQLLPGTQDTVSFPTWTATVPGVSAVHCSTGLSGDQNPANDTLSNSVTVRLKVDAAGIAIVAPLGALDSGSTVTPIARIQNLGARTAMIPVTLTIGSGYADTKTKILAAGVADTIAFADWQATRIGTQIIKCTTQLTGDQHPENDRVIDSCIVRARLDASADLIQAPTGTVDSGQTIVPIARITNRSTRALTIPVNLRITDGYSAARSKLLAIGASDTVHFAAWTATQLGSFVVKCSTALVGDVNPVNDTVSGSVTVRAGIDAASVAIIAPTGTLDSGTVVTPVVRIANNGTRNALIPVRLRIGSGYDTTITKSLARGTQDTVGFPTWVASPLGVFQVRCSTGLSGDQHPENDTLSSSVTVQARIDAAALAIIAPTGIVDSGTSIIPVARIANYSTRTELIPVRLQIGSVYSESTTKSLAPGIADTVSFPVYTALAPGRYVVRCTVGLTGDQVPGNNVVTDSFLVRVHLDVGVTQILAPTGSTDSGVVFTPTALVHNYGTRSLTAPVRMKVGATYNQQVSQFIAAGMTDTVSFPSWTASPLGVLAVKCSTELADDENTGNDRRIDSVIVGVRIDAASIAIVAPTGTVDSGTVVTPLVRIANFGTRSAAIPVTLNIGTLYQKNRTKTIPAGATDTMNFALWTASELGINVIRCSTGLANDRDHSNDTISSTVLVRARIDAASVTIVAPTGSVDSGISVTPVIRIANNGSRTELIPVRLRIGSGYDTSATKQLLPGTQDTVVFATWTATVPGVNAVRCSTGLAGDQNPANDTLSSSVTVRTRIDAAVQAIVSPTGTLDSGATVTPVVRIANNGTGAALIPARLRIGSFYDQTQSKLLAPGTNDTVAFPDWNALQVGTHVVRCSLMLVGDAVPVNDTLSGNVTVRTRVDAASIAIIAPIGTLDSGTTVTPIARIQNLGTRAAMIPVTLTIGSGYADTKSRILQPGVTDTIAFADWQATRLGTQIIKCTTQLTGDQHPENDRVIDSCIVRARLDASADLIQAPTGTVDSGQTIIPIAQITNRSTRALTIPVNLRITDGYSAARSKLLAIGASDTVHFAAWTATQLGSFTVKCSTALVGDVNPVNDTVSSSVTVRAMIDAASIAILAPAGIVDSGATITPTLRISNNGTRNELVPVRLRIGSGYDTTRTKLLVHGTQDTVLFPVWTASQLGSFPIRCSTGLANDQNPANDTLSSSVTVRARIDAAALAIIAPTGIVDSGTSIIPVARIANYSTRTELIPVRLQIGSVYSESTTKSLAPGIIDTVSFPVYTALAPGRYVVRCTVGLTGDQVPENNLVVDSFLVRVHLDVGVTQILAPTGSTDSGTVFTPTALVHNYGTRSLTTPVRMRIGLGYNQQVSKYVAAGATDTASFPTWTASPLGVLPVRCSTELTGDENASNDARTDSVIVGVRIDAASIAIIAPVGTVDSGTMSTPLVRIANLSTRTYSIPVTLRIGTTYQRTRTKTFAAGVTDTMNLPFWTANELGINVIRCSTGLANDRDHSNDTISSTVLVRARIDAASVTIVAPTGSVDSGISVTPVIRIANNGSRTELIPVRLRIGSGYDTSATKQLLPGTQDTVGFPTWTATVPGVNAVRCSTGLAGDQNPANDTLSSSVTVRTRIDAAVQAIVSPTGTLDSGATVTPVVRIANNGTSAALIPARLRIGSFYDQTQSKLLAPGTNDTVVFPDWNALQVGTHVVRCSLMLAGDGVPANDTLSGSVTVRTRIDAASIAIVAPIGTLDSGTTVTPIARIQNLGTRAAMIPVTLTIGSGYADTKTKILAAGVADTIAFADWQATRLGTQIIKCTTQLTGDQHPENDRIIDSCIVRAWLDAASVAIIVPAGTVDSGLVFNPVVRVANLGTRAGSIPVTLKIGVLYRRTRTKVFAAGVTDTMALPFWTATELGVNAIRCSTGLAGDMNPVNDTLSGTVIVRARIDAAALAIVSPTGTVDSGSVIAPVVRIANNGARQEAVPVFVRIGADYADSTIKVLSPGSNDTVILAPWVASPLGTASVRCSVGLSNDQNPANDTVSSSVTVQARIDAAALAIIAPAGTLDSGTTVIPVARISNLGTRTELIPVRLQIGSVYAESTTKLLAPGVADTVSFPAYTALAPARYTVRCTVGLTGDQVPGNNLVVDSFLVRVHLDVGVTQILAPVGNTDSGTVITPGALVHNYGTRSLMTPVRMRIGSSYDQQDSLFLSAGATDTITFPDWIASPLGVLAVKCSTGLTGDENTANDARTDSVMVGVRFDAASITIIAPTGIVDSGTMVAPLVRIANFGTRSASIPVTLTIGLTYQHTRTKTLPAGVTDTMSLPFWTANELGVNAIRCSTGLSGDQNPANDTCSGQVEVATRVDAGVTAIIAPVGTLDSGSAVTPAVRVANLGTRPADVPVRLTIGALYDQTVTHHLDIGATDVVEFPDWTAAEVGVLAVRCSLELAGDQVPANDTLSGVVTVLTRIDAAALAIIAPAGLLDSGSVVTPIVRIANNGTSAALIPARLAIDSLYDQTASKLLAPGASDTVLFPEWSAVEVGVHVVRCSLMLIGDEVPANDTISGSVTVQVNTDAASIAIIAPLGAVDSGTVTTPVARIANLGQRAALIPAILTIGSDYTGTRIKSLEPGTSDTVTFADWTATTLGWQTVKCTTALDADRHPENDAIQDSVLVGARLDAQAIAILAPTGSADSGDVITPIVTVRNNSTRSLWIPVRLKIGSDYNRFRNKWLMAGAEDTVRFASWTASPLGTIAVRCSTYLFGDQNPSNDTLSDSILVGARVDAAAQMIIAPFGIVDSGASVTPVAQVANLGTRREAIPVFLAIGTTYAESAVRILDPGISGAVSFPLWTAGELGLFPVRCSVALAQDRQPANDTVSGSVKVKAGIDAGVIIIIAPRGDVDSGTAITPKVLVANLGTRTEAIPAKLLIGSFYAESTLRILMPGRQDTVRFPQFVAEQLGTHTVRCSLSLTDDRNPANDTASAELRIRPRIDAAPIAIIAPLGSVDSGTTVTPKVLVTNYGAHLELIPVRLTIGSGYADSVFRLFAPGASDTVRFAPWTATEVGMNAIRCTTGLALDQHPENDLLIDSVAVGVLTDAGAVQLYAPTGLIDSGTTVFPRALVRNFGSRPALIPVMMRIGSNYEQRVTRTIPAGRSVTVVFPSWIAQPVGTQAVKCSTGLDNDRNPENNAVSDSVTVRFYHDVAAVRILAPTGICDSGAIVTPCAIVANYGMEPAKFPVFFRIGMSDASDASDRSDAPYAESLVVRLAPGAEDTFRFADWPANELGTFAVTCSVALSGDRNPDNDCLRDSVLVRPTIDAASIMILAPVGTVDSGATIQPQALVANNGTRTELVPVRLTIGSDYADSVFRLMAPGASDTVTFRDWTAGTMTNPTQSSFVNRKSSFRAGSLAPGVSRHPLPRSLTQVRCSTGLMGDQYPVNDTVSTLVEIAVHRDAAVLNIIAPAGEIDSGTVLAPSAVIANLGTSPANIPVTMRIGSTYLQTVSRFVLPQQTDTAVFPLWIALERDTNIAECSVALPGDTNPANNQVSDTFDVRVQDVGAIALLAPPNRVSMGDTFVPRALVFNFGNRSATFPARFRIESQSRTGLTGRTSPTFKAPVFFYSDSSMVTDLAPGASAEVSFAPWIAEPGAYAVSCSTEYALDLNPFNDKITDSVNSAPRNLLLVPDSSCITQPGTLVEYRLRLTNLGNNPDTVDIRFSGLHANWQLELTDTLRRPLADLNGNSLPDVGELRAHDTCVFLARITVPADAPAHTTDLTRVKAQSGRDSLIWDQVQLQTEVGSASNITIEPSQQDTTGPGVPVSYTLYVHNYGNAADIADLGLVHAQPGWQYELLDRDGTPLPDLNGNGMPEIGPIAPFGTETQFELRVTPAADARAGLEDSLIIQAFSTNNLDLYQDEVLINTCVSPSLSSLVLEADQQDNARPGDVSYYALWAEIQGNIDDVVELRVNASQPGWGVGVLEPDRQTRLTDTDSDSLIDLGVLTCGQPRRFVLRVAAPEHANLNGSPDSFAALRVTVTGSSAQFPNLKDSAVVLVTLIPNVSAHTYPNPADDHTAFVFGLPEPGRVSITLYDRAATLVYKLLDGAEFNQGPQTVNWNMHNRANRTIAPGTYYYVFDFVPDDGPAERVLGKLVKR